MVLVPLVEISVGRTIEQYVHNLVLYEVRIAVQWECNEQGGFEILFFEGRCVLNRRRCFAYEVFYFSVWRCGKPLFAVSVDCGSSWHSTKTTFQVVCQRPPINHSWNTPYFDERRYGIDHFMWKHHFPYWLSLEKRALRVPKTTHFAYFMLFVAHFELAAFLTVFSACNFYISLCRQ